MPQVWPSTPPSPTHRAAFADAVAAPFWLDRLPPRQPLAALSGERRAELAIVGGGLTGLWAALLAKLEDPDREVVLLEAETLGFGGSGRNGGFLSSSLTHGIDNGLDKFADELPTLERLGLENYRGFLEDLGRLGIDCALEETGELTVALEPHQEGWLREAEERLRRFGHEVELLDGEAMRAEVASPTYRGGLWDRTGAALLDPGALLDGMRAAASRLGVRICERSAVEAVRPAAGGVELSCAGGTLLADRALVAAGGSRRSPLRAVRRYVAPVYDYVLVTEPLAAGRLESIGWRRRQGLTDPANRFHYYRRVGEDRLLWGGYDAVYRFGGPVDPGLDDHEPTFARLSQHFFTTFPQLEGVRFSHRWGGAIDTCSRFAPFFGSAQRGRVAYVAGYTGLGVGASRFGARVALDLLAGRRTEATRLRYVRRRPLPFPPEPLRWAVIQLTRSRLAAADRHEGRRGRWLRLLDRLGVGFDS